ncbi:hypothetical protein OJ997_27790 [Solirubrobacter phytolaccae]|uniref:Fibronectin type-III domain-containing protein n=1 Tax=Solirubrobacter phytolaccae TaxID=1404360 RepID=A0A9X3SAX0_9ACTN|nr:fibronectin type III domain-containing protein [Solirubrobacter phytolaccae]MDA0184143.1 hypothetical protein [Solirubrobacter phytolaccae]
MTYGRVLSTLAVVAAVAGGAAAPAHAAVTTSYPSAAEARTFATTSGGWTATNAFSGVCILCSDPAGTYVSTGGAGGTGDGHLRGTFTTSVGVLSTSTVTWTSPAFTVSGAPDSSVLTAKVRPQLGSILALLASDADLTATITDVATPASSTTLPAHALSTNATFAPVNLTVPNGALVAGRTYKLTLALHVHGGIAAAIQTGTVDLDDVALNVSDLAQPSALTASADTTAGVKITGSVDPHGQATAVSVQYGPTAAYGTSTSVTAVNGTGAQNFSFPLAGLTPGATYHYRVRAANADGESFTSDATFVVPAIPSDAAPSVNGDLKSRTRTVIYDQVPGTTAVNIQVLAADNTTVLSNTPDPDLDGTAQITLPDADGVYYVRIQRTSSGGTSTSAGVLAQLDRVGPANAAAPVVTGDVSVRPRHVQFVRASDATAATVQILSAGGTVLSSTPVAAGGDVDVTLPDTDGTYLVRVIQTDAAGNATTSPSASVELNRQTRGTGGEDTPAPPTDPVTPVTPEPPVTTTTVNGDPGGWGALLASCYGNGKLALVDVRTAGKTVKFAGAAAQPVGTAVTIVDKAGKTVATAKIGADGRFAASIKRPKAKVLRSARYRAVVGTTKSLALKATRVASVSKLSVSGTTATLTGTVDPRKLKAGKSLKVAARGGRGGTACAVLGGGKLTTVGKAKINKKTGKFTVKVKVPGTGRVAVRVAFSGGVRTATLYAVR